VNRHPITVFVLAVLAVIGIGVGVLAGASKAGLGPMGEISGGFYVEGGPIASLKAPVSGPVTLTSTAGSTFTTTASNGEWALSVPPGTYAVSGFDPRAKWHCTAGNVTVRASRSVSGVLIVCRML